MAQGEYVRVGLGMIGVLRLTSSALAMPKGRE